VLQVSAGSGAGVCEEDLFGTALLAQLVCLLVIVAWVLACSMIVFIILSSHGDNYFEDRLVATLTVQN